MAKPLFTHVLELARALVADQGSWTRHALARTGNNRQCDPTDAKAVRFCAHGALVRAAYDLTADRHQANQLADQVAMWITGRVSVKHAQHALWWLNDEGRDSRTAVLRLFDKCLAQR
jgi:hypothetical protein